MRIIFSRKLLRLERLTHIPTQDLCVSSPCHSSSRVYKQEWQQGLKGKAARVKHFHDIPLPSTVLEYLVEMLKSQLGVRCALLWAKETTDYGVSWPPLTNELWMDSHLRHNNCYYNIDNLNVWNGYHVTLSRQWVYQQWVTAGKYNANLILDICSTEHGDVVFRI